jgi:glutamyl-tRNA reductase
VPDAFWMRRSIASRLLHEPTLRLKRSADDETAYAYVDALRELFALDPGAAPLEAEDAEVTELDERRRSR